MNEPLPCPFCGKTPKILPVDSTIEGGAWGQVKCTNKLCPAKPSVYDGEMLVDDRGSDAYKKAAIERWNIRHVTNETKL